MIKNRIRENYAHALEVILVRKHIGNKAFLARNLGISRRHLNYILSGTRYPGRDLHEKINKTLEINLPYNRTYTIKQEINPA